MSLKQLKELAKYHKLKAYATKPELIAALSAILIEDKSEKVIQL